MNSTLRQVRDEQAFNRLVDILRKRFAAEGSLPAERTMAKQLNVKRHQLRGALEVYRLERGEYPETLWKLVDVGLAAPRDVSYPWAEPYFYRRRPEGRYVLLPPVE